MSNKKLLIIEGFGRSNGYTKQLSDYAASLFDGYEKISFNCFEKNAKCCDGCSKCLETGVCKFRDLDGFFEVFENCDAMIIATPVYNCSFPAPLKAVVDRFQLYYNAFYDGGKKQPIAKKRKAMLVVSSGRDGKYSVGVMENQLVTAFSILNIEYVGAALCNFTDTAPDVDKAKLDVNKLINNLLI